MNIIQPEHIAIKLGKSKRWVYSHALDLGGKKIGGSWFFTEEGFENAILGNDEENVAWTGQVPRSKFSSRLPHKTGSYRLGSKKTKRTTDVGTEDDTDRHGLAKFF